MTDKQELEKPQWLKVKATLGPNYQRLKVMMRGEQLHTVCEEAHCPNIYECWEQDKTATFMILGDTCTRNCRFCAVKSGHPGFLDWEEPERVAQTVQKMGLDHVVITSVDRDDVPDGGSTLFRLTIEAVRRLSPRCQVEVLIPDFQGDRQALEQVQELRIIPFHLLRSVLLSISLTFK